MQGISAFPRAGGSVSFSFGFYSASTGARCQTTPELNMLGPWRPATTPLKRLVWSAVRYIGNKTKLLSFIGDFLDEMNIREGRALDAFAGTTSVSSYLKRRGFEVDACDILSTSYVFQRAYIVPNAYPSFEGLTGDGGLTEVRNDSEFRQRVESRFEGQGDLFGSLPSEAKALEEALVYMDTFLPPQASFVTDHYSAPLDATEGARMYFTEDNAKRIDAIRVQLYEWIHRGLIAEDEFYLLLASLLEAADSVANTTGVYAAFVKTWQSNAVRPLTLALPKSLPRPI